jgi:type VI secretion system FHA domain protein
VLKDGDYVRLGQYEFLVSIDQSNDFPPEEGAIVAYDGHSPSAAAKKSTADDLGADLDLSQLLEPSDLSIESGLRPRDAYGQAVPARAPENAAEPASGTPWHMLTRPLKVETPKAEFSGGALPRASGPALFDGDFDVGLSAFCRGAGIEPRAITSEARGAALQLAGQLLREAVLGLMDLNQGRTEFLNRFRIDLRAAETAESPLNLSRGVDEALVRLLTTVSTRAGSVEAIRENFRELKAQNGATLVAMRAAFEEFLGRVDPKELEERFERAPKRGVFGGQSKARYWELYSELFAGVAQRPAEGFPHLYTEAFAKAYEAKMRALMPPRRSSFGQAAAGADDRDDQAAGDT